jgi:hypothetical protein
MKILPFPFQHFRISHFAFDDEYTNTILRVITIEKKQVKRIAHSDFSNETSHDII